MTRVQWWVYGVLASFATAGTAGTFVGCGGDDTNQGEGTDSGAGSERHSRM